MIQHSNPSLSAPRTRDFTGAALSLFLVMVAMLAISIPSQDRITFNGITRAAPIPDEGTWNLPDHVVSTGSVPLADFAKYFPALKDSLEIRAKFEPATWWIDHRMVEGVQRHIGPSDLTGVDNKRHVSVAPSLQSFFPHRFTDGFGVTAGGLTVWSLPIQGMSATAELDNGRVVYRNAYHRTDAIYTSTPGRSEEFLVLWDSSAPTRFDHRISNPTKDLQISPQVDGGLTISDSSGHHVQIEPPWVIDATGRKSGLATRLIAQKNADGASWNVSLRLDPTGLTYPLVIDPTWRDTGSLSTGRTQHTATLLPSGKVLVTGGNSGFLTSTLASCEIYDPATGTWAATGSLQSTRKNHSAILLYNGTVLVMGGGLSTCEVYNPATGTWTTTAAMSTPRQQFTATLLSSGKVLVTGGTDGSGARLTSSEIYSPAGFSGSWTPTGSMANARSNHQATLLSTGKVLVTGGLSTGGGACELYDPNTGIWVGTGSQSNGSSTATALTTGKVLTTGGGIGQLYDPGTGLWTATGTMVDSRAFYYYSTATLLPSGKVLVTGGGGSLGAKATCEEYDPSSGAWSSAGSLSVIRQEHTATLLPSGQVLVTGGFDSFNIWYAKSELYDPNVATWNPTGAMATSRRYASATLLLTGKILVAGGGSRPIGSTGATGSVPQAGCELFDPAAGTWTSTGSLSNARERHTATLLPSGKVLVTGGAGSGTSQSELYDPATGTWKNTKTLGTGGTYQQATLLPTGKVLISAGFGTTFHLYDETSDTWTITGSIPNGSFFRAHTYASATLLTSGKVLLAGGDSSSFPSNSTLCDLYDPNSGSWSTTGNLITGRILHTATLLPSGKILVAGGVSGSTSNPLTSCELFDPNTGIWSATGAMSTARFLHKAILLPSGKVVVFGGSNTSLGGSLSSCEWYDPAAGTWTSIPSMATARMEFAANLLPDGRVLAVGGSQGIYFSGTEATVSSCDLLDFTPGFSAVDRPVFNPSSTLVYGSTLGFSGTLFTGRSEASSGGSQSSPTNFPLVQIQSAVNEQQQHLLYGSPSAFTPTFLITGLVTGIPLGPAWVRVFVNGIPSIAKPITIVQGMQTISGFTTLSNRTYGGGPFTINGVAGGGSSQPVVFTSSNAAVATVAGTTVTIKGVGTTTIFANQAGDAYYAAAPLVAQSLTIIAAPLTVTAANASRAFGNANPFFSGTLSGVVPGDSITASYSSSANAATPAGTYGPSTPEAITPTLSDPGTRLGNYTVTITKGTLTLSKATQSISGFSAFGSHVYGGAPINLSGVTGGGSGQPVVFTSSNPTVATVSGSLVTIVAAGTTVISANQAGTTNYAAAATVSQTLTVTKAALTVIAASASRAYAAANPSFTGTFTGLVNGDAITATYASAATGTTPAGIYDPTTPQAITPTLVDPGARLGNYTVALINGTLTIGKASQIISGFTTFPTHVYGDVPISLAGALGGGSGQPVIFASSNLAVATVSGSTLTIVGAGAATITATQAGSNDYLPAINVAQTLTVAKAPLLVIAAAASRIFGEGNPPFTGTLSGVVTGDVIAAIYTSIATIDTAIGIYGAATAEAITPTLSDPGNRLENYTVTAINGTLTITQIPQMILGFTPIAAHVYGDADFTINGVTGGGSGQGIIFSSSNPAVAMVTGSTVTIVGAGTAIITASQIGTAIFADAPTIAQPLTIAPATLSVTANAASRAYGMPNPVFTGMLTGIVRDDQIAASYVSSAGTATSPGIYGPSSLEAITPVIADPGARLGNYTLLTTKGTLTITLAPQVVLGFAPLPPRVYGDAQFVISGVTAGGSGQPIVFTSDNPAVATVHGSLVTITGAGRAVISATQAGITDYFLAATPVMQTLNVGKADLRVVAADAIRIFGATNGVPFTGSLLGVVTGDPISATYSSTASSTTAIGTYGPGTPEAVTPMLTDPDHRLVNYSVTLVQGTLTVVPASIDDPSSSDCGVGGGLGIVLLLLGFIACRRRHG